MKQRDCRIANYPPDMRDNVPTFLRRHFEHCRERLRERYGIAISYQDWEELNLRVYNEVNCEFLFKPNPRTANYKLIYKGKKIGAMFSTQLQCVTSVMPDNDCRLNLIKPTAS